MSTFETRAEIVLTHHPHHHHHHQFDHPPVESVQISAPPMSKPTRQLAAKSVRHVRKSHHHASKLRSKDSSIAPLLETISALAINSDGSDCSDCEDEDQQQHLRVSGVHQEDNDEEEDEYDYEQQTDSNEAGGNHQESRDDNAIGDNDLSSEGQRLMNDDLSQYITEDRAGSALPRGHLAKVMNVKSDLENAFSNLLGRGKSHNGNARTGKVSIDVPSWTNKAANLSPVVSAANNGKCVRFNADVQITSVSPRMVHKVVSGGSNQHQGYQANHQQQYLHSRSGAMDLTQMDNAPSEMSSNTYDEVAESHPQSPKLGYKVEVGGHEQLNSRVVRDISMVELQQRKTKKKQPGDFDPTVPPQPQYVNLEMLQESAKVTEVRPNAFNSFNPMSHQPPTAQSTHHQQKSILKDPLCAKLRSAIRKGQFAINVPANLESEIDSLLYGNESTGKNESSVDEVIIKPNDLESCDILGGQLNHNMGGPFEYSNCHFAKSPKSQKRSKSNSANNKFGNNVTGSNTAPCNSYIQMIEEKYRHKDSSSSGAGAGDKAQSKSKSTNKSSSKGSKSKTGGEEKSKMLKPSHPAVRNMAVGMDFNSKYRYTASPSTFDSSYLHHSKQHCSMPMFSSTMDQLMSNIIQESVQRSAKDPKKTKPDVANVGDQVGKMARKATRPAPQLNSTVENDKLYSLFADPIKGPCINLLMDELSRNFNSLHHSDTESNRSSHSNLSTISKSLAENHIYEEILYECLEKQGQMTGAKMGHPSSLNDNGLFKSSKVDALDMASLNISSLLAPNSMTHNSILESAHK